MVTRLGLFCAVFSIGLLDSSKASAQERFTLAGPAVAVYNLAGALHITAGSGANTEVEVARVGRDARALRVVTGEIDGASTLRVIYPGDEIAYRDPQGHRTQTTLRVHEDGTFGRGGGGRQVRISTSDRAGPDAIDAGADLMVRVPAGVRLLARVGVGQAEVRNVNGTITVDNSAGSITARGARGTLILNSASGGIDAEDIEAELAVKTASGGVKLEQVKGHEVKVNVASGRIRARDVMTNVLDLYTASGSIDVTDISASDARLRTASGSIDAALNGALRNVKISSASGSVRVGLPDNLDAEIEVETASGSIHADLPINLTQQRRGYMRGVLGAGTGRVEISTASGSVTLRAR